MPTIRDVATAAGVSISTVSNVLNGKSNASEETRRRVLDVCAELGYSGAASARRLHKSDNKTILFNFSDFDRSFYLQIIKGISDYVSNVDYDLMICTKKSVGKFMNSGTRGCIICDMAMDDEMLCRTASARYPVVVLDRIIDSPFIKSVVVDNYASMGAMVQELVRRGYKKFAFLGGPEKTDDHKERYKAFRDTLAQNNIPFHSKDYYSGDYRAKSGYTAARIIMLSESKPEVLVCANDNMAAGAIKAFRENKLQVPQDIAVTGFDNTHLAETVGLSTISVPDYERGYLAAQYLLENIKGRVNNETFRIQASMVWRDSVLPSVNGAAAGL